MCETEEKICWGYLEYCGLHSWKWLKYNQTQGPTFLMISTEWIRIGLLWGRILSVFKKLIRNSSTVILMNRSSFEKGHPRGASLRSILQSWSWSAPLEEGSMHLVINEKMSNLAIVDFIGSQQPIFQLLYIVEGTLDS